MNYFDVNSPPLSDLKHFIFYSVSVSTISLYILKCSNASDFLLRKKIVVILVYSSTNNIKYCSPFKHFVLFGPHRSICTISSGFFVEYSFDLNLVLFFFPYRQCLHRVFVGFEYQEFLLLLPFFLILTRLSKFM
jgi:hypothetical protein